MKVSIAVLFALVAAATIAGEVKKYDFPLPDAQNSLPPSACAFAGLNLPANTRVYAAGGYSGRKLDYQIDQSGHAATQFDLAVNSPDAPVVLMLGAYEPTVWSIGWTRRTKIVAVLVSGYHRQALAGVDANVPVINSSHDNKGPCGYFYLGGESQTSANSLARKLFNREVDRQFAIDRNGRAVIGDPLGSTADLVTSTSNSPESFYDKNAPLAGEAGLKDAVNQGVLRPATVADFNAWQTAMAEASPSSPRHRTMTRPGTEVLTQQYVILKQFTFPAGLYGAHSATFYLPRGVPRPSGNRGHSSVNDFNSLSCEGALCPRSAPTARVDARAAAAPPPGGSTSNRVERKSQNADAVNYGAGAPAARYGSAVPPANHASAAPAVLSLDNALENGSIRLATRADSDEWQQVAAARSYRKPPSVNTYVVLRHISFPPGSATEDAATFIVPRGVPTPAGAQGFATVYDHNTLKCQGPKCD